MILFFLPEDGLIGTETCFIIEAYCVNFDGRFYEGNLKSVGYIPIQFGDCV